MPVREGMWAASASQGNELVSRYRGAHVSTSMSSSRVHAPFRMPGRSTCREALHLCHTRTQHLPRCVTPLSHTYAAPAEKHYTFVTHVRSSCRETLHLCHTLTQHLPRCVTPLSHTYAAPAEMRYTFVTHLKR
eukprot:8307538-Pyramimonas_sp.AAC.2